MTDKKKPSKARQPIITPLQLAGFIVSLILYTTIWLSGALFGQKPLNLPYYLFMFIATCIWWVYAVLTKGIESAPDPPKKPTQIFGNLAKSIIDTVITEKGKKDTNPKNLTDTLIKAVMWHLREARVDTGLDQDVIDDVMEYFNKQLNDTKKEEKPKKDKK